MNIFSAPNKNARTAWLAKAIHHLYPIFQFSEASSSHSDLRSIIQPYLNDERYHYAQYQFCFPNLIQPETFLNVRASFGESGLYGLDTHNASATDPIADVQLAYNCHLLDSTINSSDSFHKADVISSTDKLLLGQQLLIEGNSPTFKIKGESSSLRYEIEVSLCSPVSWFAKSWLYDHLNCMTRYSGYIQTNSKHDEVQGTGTFDFVRSALASTPKSYARELIGSLPVYFVTQHMLNLDAQTQVIFYRMDLAGKPLCNTVLIRHSGGLCEVYGDVIFSVIQYQPSPVQSPNGHGTLVAEQFEWTVYDNNGDMRLSVYAQLNSLPYTGYGQGYIAGFKFKAQQLNSVSHGHGMMAHVDIMDPQNLDQKSFNEQYGGEFMPKT
ncbi:DUF6670 family protein [uncultured Acinetobacter sp.]|uniref:DUF6670 family protein n=1 Tax=uncultured Acinetobacter sp. TaxID=165433 RepID=UPI0037499FDE